MSEQSSRREFLQNTVVQTAAGLTITAASSAAMQAAATPANSFTGELEWRKSSPACTTGGLAALAS